MESLRLAVLGAGSARCSPAVIASLANYFGERPLEIRLYDADEERLDLFDRFARTCFLLTNANHELIATSDFGEALEEADLVILQVGRNCARKMKPPMDSVAEALGVILPGVPESAEVISLQHPDIELSGIQRVEWPDELAAEERSRLPHQIMRWIRGEEWPWDLLKLHERGPIRAWLDNPRTADLNA